MRLDSERLQRLRCAHEENCLAKSADVLFSPRYVYPLFYSSFNTHPKVAYSRAPRENVHVLIGYILKACN